MDPTRLADFDPRRSVELNAKNVKGHRKVPHTHIEVPHTVMSDGFVAGDL